MRYDKEAIEVLTEQDFRDSEYLIALKETDTQTWTTKCLPREWTVQVSIGLASEITGTNSWATNFVGMTEPSLK